MIAENRLTNPVAGGAVLVHGLANALVRNNTIIANRSTAPEGNAVLAIGTVEISESIVWANGGTDPILAFRGQGQIEVWSSIVEGGWLGEGGDNLAVNPGLVDVLQGDYHLAPDSPAVDAGKGSGNGIDTDIEGDARVVDGDGDGLAVRDIGADELLREIAARFGRTSAGDDQGGLFGALRVNGQLGDRQRVIRTSVREPIVLEVLAPPEGPVPARFACYAWGAEPDLTTLTLQPCGLGMMSFPTPLAGGPINLPIRIWNNLGRRQRLGQPDRSSSPAPSVLAVLESGIPFETTVTLQGFIEDTGSLADGPLSITNAVVIEVGP